MKGESVTPHIVSLKRHLYQLLTTFIAYYSEGLDILRVIFLKGQKM